jgi:hypothetical protein
LTNPSESVVKVFGERDRYSLGMSDIIKLGSHPQTLGTESNAQSNALPNRTERPEFYRLPKSGGDPYFAFGRSFYYEGEKRGYWKLVRIRERGKLRGVTLVPYDMVAAFVRKQMVEEAA